MRNKYYIFYTSCDYVDAVCSLIKFVGGSVYTIITNRKIPDGNINHCRVYCRLSWSQMIRLKRRLKDGKNKFIELSCYKRVNKLVYKLAWRRIIPHYLSPSIRKIKPNFGYDVGFNCRRYDNHILYARISHHSSEQLFNLSQAILNGERV